MRKTGPATRQLNLVAAGTNDNPLRADGRRAWVLLALCKESPEDLFVHGSEQNRAAAICRSCPVMQECAVDALDGKMEYGVWGGMTERQRRALLKQHPDVVSWADHLRKRGVRDVG